ncbi:MAG: hypothetical protein KA168_04685 [Chitinophagales bacterium]|nr:hypothetical protein [Chitinophagales bacterium]
MYLIPLNYDPFFKKVFSDVNIAKHFLEDFFDITIQSIELLPLNHKVTNNAAHVSFDFRCKINGQYVIIDMQQWYKSDIVKRFYVYHSLATVLQLENLSKKKQNNKNKKTEQLPRITEDYHQIAPVITLIWMVNDSLGFSDDYVSYSSLPDALALFIRNNTLWQSADKKMLTNERNKLLKLLDNNTKDLNFMQENKLIYAFQKNIVKNAKYTKYYEWFEFAERSLKKDNTEADFEKYNNRDVFLEMMHRLKAGTMTNEDADLIVLYNEFTHTVDDLEEAIKQQKQRAEEAQKQLRAEKQRAEEEKQRAEEAQKQLRTEKQRAEEEKQRAETEKQQRLIAAKAMKNDGMPIDQIARYLNLTPDELAQL